MNENRIIFYKDNEKIVTASVIYNNGTFWLTQKSMADLFKVTVDNVGLHLKNIYNEGELVKKATIEQHSIVQREGLRRVKREVLFYNLEATILVAFRIKTKEATTFRKWITKELSSYIVNGAIQDDLLLKNTKPFNDTYFGELKEKETIQS